MTPIPILLYHRFGRGGDPLSTPTAVFERQLAWLAGRGFRSLRLDEFERRLADGRGGAPRKELLITFDDGYAELASIAAPALRRHGFSGVAFLITGECGTGANHVTWEQARALAAEGVIEFQSHSHSHRRWRPDDDGGRELERDLATSLERLAGELRRPRSDFRHLAWPWGICDENWERIAARLGFRYQHIVQRGAVTRTGGTLRLPRFCLDGASVGAFRGWLTLLSLPGGAKLCNKVFGAIRTHRQGLGYA
ncbi:MAG: polysaccharide deacetylase family protein [Burkholderiales bacterium]|nr:polysaccharide deacetylase family protein [Burkholderiales bacterium]